MLTQYVYVLAQNLLSVLNKMVDTLKVRIDTTEKALGDKLNVLDKDGDGELSSQELKDAITNILRSVSEAEAEEIVRGLDSNADGKISVLELLQYVESRKNNSEIEMFEVRVDFLCPIY